MSSWTAVVGCSPQLRCGFSLAVFHMSLRFFADWLQRGATTCNVAPSLHGEKCNATQRALISALHVALRGADSTPDLWFFTRPLANSA